MLSKTIHFISFFLLFQPMGLLYASSGKDISEVNTEMIFEHSMHATMNKMHHEMLNYKFSRNKELDFLKMMIPHHQAAIDMSKVIIETSKNKEIRNLAYSIITEQNNEINIMNKLIEDEKYAFK